MAFSKFVANPKSNLNANPNPKSKMSFSKTKKLLATTATVLVSPAGWGEGLDGVETGLAVLDVGVHGVKLNRWRLKVLPAPPAAHAHVEESQHRGPDNFDLFLQGRNNEALEKEVKRAWNSASVAKQQAFGVESDANLHEANRKSQQAMQSTAPADEYEEYYLPPAIAVNNLPLLEEHKTYDTVRIGVLNLKFTHDPYTEHMIPCMYAPHDPNTENMSMTHKFYTYESMYTKYISDLLGRVTRKTSTSAVQNIKDFFKEENRMSPIHSVARPIFTVRDDRTGRREIEYEFDLSSETPSLFLQSPTFSSVMHVTGTNDRYKVWPVLQQIMDNQISTHIEHLQRESINYRIIRAWAQDEENEMHRSALRRPGSAPADRRRTALPVQHRQEAPPTQEAYSDLKTGARNFGEGARRAWKGFCAL
jgi:hypothetical protein